MGLLQNALVENGTVNEKVVDKELVFLISRQNREQARIVCFLLLYSDATICSVIQGMQYHHYFKLEADQHISMLSGDILD